MSTYHKFVSCLVAAVAALVSVIARAEVPDTQWTVTEPPSWNKDATFSDDTGWTFTLSSAGLLKRTRSGTATALNFRTVSLQCGYQIVTVNDSLMLSEASIQEVYFPSTLTRVNRNAFNACRGLRVFSVPENNISFFGDEAFARCNVLEELPISAAATSFGSKCFLECYVAKVPAGVTLFDPKISFPSSFQIMLSGCTNVTGTVYIGDAKTNVALGNADSGLSNSGVNEIVFGEAQTTGGTGSRGLTYNWNNGKQTLTNVVIRNPETFAIGTDDFHPNYCKNVLTYDIAGWITGGVAGGTEYKVCYLANRSVPNWNAWANDPANYTLWEDCSEADQQKYWDAHNGGVVGSEPPFALTKDLTFEGLQFKKNYWVRFKKETAKQKTIAIHVDADEKDYPSADPAVYPDYTVPCGMTLDMDAEGYTFPLVIAAPEYIVATTTLSNNLWRVVGGKMTEINLDTAEYEDYATIVGASYTFNPGRNGTWRLRWDSVRVGASITLDMSKAGALGTVSFDKVPDVEIGIGYYATNTEVQVTAIPAEGARFVRWFGDCPAGEEANSVITVTMDEGKTLQPWFEPSRYALVTTPIRNPDGASVTMVPEPGEDGKYAADTMVTLTANDGDPAHPFRMWGFQDGLDHPERCSRTITIRVDQAMSIRPIYAFDSWFYDGTYVYDGGWRFKKSSVANSVITCFNAQTEEQLDYAGDSELDMKKPIYDADGNAYTFASLPINMFNYTRAKQIVASIEALRFGPSQTTTGGNAFISTVPFPRLNVWEISATSYVHTHTPDWPKVVYFSSPAFSQAQNCASIRLAADYKQTIRFNAKNQYMSDFAHDETKVRPWRRLTADQRAKYDPQFFGQSSGYHPYGLILSGNGLFRQNVWIEADCKPGLILVIR